MRTASQSNLTGEFAHLSISPKDRLEHRGIEFALDIDLQPMSFKLSMLFSFFRGGEGQAFQLARSTEELDHFEFASARCL